MIRTIALMLALGVAVTTAVAEPAGHHRFENPERWFKVWDSPDRHAWQQIPSLLRLIGITSGMHVADIGAGTGYVTRILSYKLGKQGHIYAVDIEPAMIEFIENREDLFPDSTVETILATPDDPKLPPGKIDVALLVNTWHHIENRTAYLGKLKQALKSPGGRVAIVDWRKGELPMGPPDESKLSRDQVVREFVDAGWTHTTESFLLRYQYVLIFSP